MLCLVAFGVDVDGRRHGLDRLAQSRLAAGKRFGKQLELGTRSTYNPATKKYYGFCHGWVPDPGDYRKSMWEKVGLPNGPTTYQELLDVGGRIKREQGVQLGIGMSNELDSNMAARAVIWSFGGSVQDERENLVLRVRIRIDDPKHTLHAGVPAFVTIGG